MPAPERAAAFPSERGAFDLHQESVVQSCQMRAAARFLRFLGKLPLGGEATHFGELLCSAPANLCSLPALSVPCGLGEGGLPVGLRITDRPHDDELVLRLGTAVEHLMPPVPPPRFSAGSAADRDSAVAIPWDAVLDDTAASRPSQARQGWPSPPASHDPHQGRTPE